MVKQLICLILLFPTLLFSGEFTASVNRNEVNLGESLDLSLTLKGTSTKYTPLINVVKQAFIIHSQQQSSNTTIINGQMSSSINWTYSLIPQKEGEIIIPPIKIDTENGTLATESISIKVVKGNSSHASEPMGMTLTTHVNNAQPYKNESVIYTVRLTSKEHLVNINMQKIQIEDAIVEHIGEPKILERMSQGIRVNVVEFSYLITPLKAGNLKIPPAIVQGSIPLRKKNHLRSLFDDDFNPFSMMQGFERIKPFALTTEEVVLDVLPPSSNVTPWLPAKSFTIEETIDESHSLKTGEPFTRTFHITAEGIRANQLPNLNDLQMEHPDYKIYADKPELKEEVKGETLKSFRSEAYTYIPKHSGSLTLPEISVVWWDRVNKEKVIARVPPRTLHILPSGEEEFTKNEISLATDEPIQKNTELKSEVSEKNPSYYGLIISLIFLLVGAITWVIFLQKKITRLTNPKPTEKKNSQDC